MVDQLTKEDNIPVTHFGIEWMASSVTTRCSTVRKIELDGMKGPYNYFNIFLPRKTPEPEKKREGVHAHCMCLYKLIYCAIISL